MGATTGERVLRATGILGGASMVVTALGFLKNLLAAYYFGTSGAMDVYLLALVIPDTAQMLSITGLFNYIPLFAEARAEKGEEEAWSTASHLLAYWLLMLAGVLIVCFIAAGVLSWMIAPGLGPEARGLYVIQTRLLLFMALATGAGRVLAAVHMSRKQFGLPALAEMSFQAASITYLVAFHDLGTMGLVGAMVLGGFCHLLVNALGLRRAGVHIPIAADPRHPAVGRMLKLSLPVYLANAGAKINQIVQAAFASMLQAGAMSALQYAYMGVDIVATTIGRSFADALFPFLSEDFAEGRGDQVRRSVHRGFVATTLLILPAAVGLGLLAHPAIVLLFQRGSFGPESTRMTVMALRIYAPLLLALGLTHLFAGVYFAQKDTMTPMKLGLTRVGISALLCWLLVPHLGHRGIALAATTSEYVKLALMWALLRGAEQREGLRLATASCARFVPAAGVMAAVVWPISQLEILAQATPGLASAAAFVGAIVAGAVTYLAAVRVFAPEDFAYFWNSLRSLLPGRLGAGASS